MKQYTSRFLKTVAVFYLSFPISHILLAAILFDIPLSHCAKILLSPFYYVVTFCTFAVGYGLWEMKRWSWYWLILSQILVTYEDATFVVDYANSHHRLAAFFISVLLQTILIYRVSREIRVPYFFPRILWWENNPRYRLSSPVRLQRKTLEVLDGEILDLSTVGCFVKLRTDLKADEKVLLSFKMFGHEIQCDGVIVWFAQSGVTYPKGVGIKFTYLVRTQKRSLRLIARKLRRISVLYRQYRYWLSEEDFLKRMIEIESSGPKDLDDGLS